MTAEPGGARRFGGIARLYGTLGLCRFAASHVCVIGIGGVGSWVVEALARSGIGQLTLIDMDHVAESNINRQILADDDTLGRAKIDVMGERVARINPGCRVRKVDDFVTVDNAARWLPGDFDFVVDCSDDFRVKAQIVARCRRARARVITVGGAGGRVDPTLIRVSDLSRTEHDPLLAAVRRQLRRVYGYTRNPARRFDVPCVYSTEQITFALADGTVCRDKSRVDTTSGLGCSGGLGSASHVTATFAFVAVGHILGKLAGPAVSRACDPVIAQ
jgi:tRNA threonylcarbamoyladenosine dehydratase